MAVNMTTSPRGMRKIRRAANEFYIKPSGTGNEAPAPATGSPPGKAAQGLPVLRVSLLAGHPLRLLLSVPFEQAGREVILCAS